MIYWLIFYLYEFSLVFLYYKIQDRNKQLFILSLICIGLIYFAGFRDGLGVDYPAYVNIFSFPSRGEFVFLEEPIYALLKKIVHYTVFSPIIFFISMAAITNICITYSYSKFNSFPLLLTIYLIYPSLYASSFNIVRQFAAAGLFLLAITLFRENKRYLNYILIIIIAILIHKSAIILFVILLVKDNNFNKLFWCSMVLFSFVIPFGHLLETLKISTIINAIGYDHYFDYTKTPISRFSLVNLFLHTIFFLFIFNLNKITNITYNKNCYFALKMFALFLICYNISANNFPIMYRIAIYFSLFVPIIMSYLKFIISKPIAYCIIFSSFTILLLLGILFNSSLSPEKMMPFDSIYDHNFKYYYNTPQFNN